MKLILINGPARSGKDSLATAFAAYASDSDKRVEVVKFAGVLKEMTHRMFGLPERHDSQEAVKDVPLPELLDRSPRQVYIAVSEKLMKPLFGQGVFGEFLVKDIDLLLEMDREDGDKPVDYFLVSDSGFLSEAEVLVERFGPQNMILVRLSRDGYSFAGDSRGYISLPGVRTLEFNLGPDLRDLNQAVESLFNVAEAL